MAPPAAEPSSSPQSKTAKKTKKAAAKKTAPKKTASAETAPRYFEFVEGNSAKFWEIRIEGTDVTTRYGKIGTDGRETTKSFKDAEAAENFAEKQITSKTDKGYVKTEPAGN